MKVVGWIFAALVVLLIGTYFGLQYWKVQTKTASPEDSVSFKRGAFEIKVDYSRPNKKGREIFGKVVPFGEVWRTGANEPTTISFNQDILFDDEKVAAGTYSLWTIPEESQWTVILNKKIPYWGIGLDRKANRDPEFDVLLVNVPTNTLNEEVEEFTIEFEYEVNL